MSLSSGLGALFSFAIVVALIPAALWLLRRSPIGRAGAVSGLKTVGMLPLSAQQRIVTIEVGSGYDRRWLVLGVTPGSITTLHTMAPQEEETPAAPAAGAKAGPATPFAQLLGRIQRGGRDAR